LTLFPECCLACLASDKTKVDEVCGPKQHAELQRARIDGTAKRSKNHCFEPEQKAMEKWRIERQTFPR
jgi:hypothetical protein